jgi:GT2 family glycosyltransferase
LHELVHRLNAPETVVILINWHGADETLLCLEAVAKLEGPRPFVIVIENGSKDESAARLRDCALIDKLIESPVNLGFGAGCNLAIAHARTLGPAFIWHLNNDARPEPQALQALVATARANPKAGAVGSVLYSDPQCRKFECWGGGKIDFRTGQPRHLKKPGTPDYITGASLLCRTDAIVEIGGFDERYFLYWEDADLCFRLRRAGWQIAVAPTSHIFHAASVSANKAGRQVIRCYNSGAIQFFRTYAPHPLRPIIFNFLYRFCGQLRAGQFKNAWTLAALYWTAWVLNRPVIRRNGRRDSSKGQLSDQLIM